ncbi:MAG: hypothetical protein ACLVK6_05040 [Lachnospiraceae bacterium]
MSARWETESSSCLTDGGQPERRASVFVRRGYRAARSAAAGHSESGAPPGDGEMGQ